MNEDVLATMTVKQLKHELSTRSLPTSGLKSQLLEHLRDAVTEIENDDQGESLKGPLEESLIDETVQEVPCEPEITTNSVKRVNCDIDEDEADAEKRIKVDDTLEEAEIDNALEEAKVDNAQEEANLAEVDTSDDIAMEIKEEVSVNDSNNTLTCDGIAMDAKQDMNSENTSMLEETRHEVDVLDSILIRNLMRPFSLDSLKDLVHQHGTVKSFWTNSVKSHCFVSFKNQDSARNAQHEIHGQCWPSARSSKPLVVDLLSESRSQDLIAEEVAKTSVSTTVSSAPIRASLGGSRSLFARATAAALQSTSSIIAPANAVAQSTEDSAVELNFKKTIAEPCIYYQPRTTAEVALKLLK